MNERLVLQLRISYLHYKLQGIPRGWVGTYLNKPVIVIYSDPQNPKVTIKSMRRYRLSTKRGQSYKSKLEERAKKEAELTELLSEWHMTYAGEPEIIPFPLYKNRFCGIKTSQYREAVPNQNSYTPKNPIIYKGQTLRSKNELLAIKEVEAMGFEWKTEICFRFGKYTFYPDVVFYVPYIDKPIALELDGMMDNDSYYEHAEERRRKYIRCGFEENKDVVFFRLNNEYDFSSEDLKTLIKIAIERSAEDLRIGASAARVIV